MTSGKKITQEDLILNDKIKFDSKGGAILGILEGPVADFIHPTRNGRLYNEELWEKVIKNDIFQEQIANGGILGELDHPKDRDDICTEKVAVCMADLPVKKSDGKYYGKFNILDTPCGRIVYTLAKAGIKLGVSSRGNGDYDEYTGEVDPDSYEFTCFDVVILPAVKDARMNLITESLNNNKSFKLLLKEQLNRSSEEDKKIMEDTLKSIKENLDNPQDQIEFKKNHPDFSKKFDFSKYGKYFNKDGKLIDEEGYFKAIEDLDEAGEAIKEAYEKHRCVICGKEFDGYGNNAEPIKDGICCDKCNQEKVIPARINNLKLKEDVENKEIPNIEVKDNILTVDIDKTPEVDKVEDEEKSCKDFDVKLKEFLHQFLKTQGLKIEGDDEEEGIFISLFHETFPELNYCTEKCDDTLEAEENKAETSAADVDGADGYDVALLEQLQNALKDNKLLKEQLRKSQVEKAVGNSKVKKLNEELDQFKNIAALAGKKALRIKDFESENAKIKGELNTLKESLNKVLNESKEKESLINELKIKANKANIEINKLREGLKQTIVKSKKEKQEIETSKQLVEKYKNFAHEIANRYIDSKALSLGVNSNEIKNRLNESYTLNDVDRICEELQAYSINISKLPFQINKEKNMRVKLREDNSKSPLKQIDSQYDDTVDDYLLELAGLKN